MPLERVEMARPETAIRLEPRVERAEAGRLDAIDALLRHDAARHETRLAQHFQMFRDGRLGDAER